MSYSIYCEVKNCKQEVILAEGGGERMGLYYCYLHINNKPRNTQDILMNAIIDNARLATSLPPFLVKDLKQVAPGIYSYEEANNKTK